MLNRPQNAYTEVARGGDSAAWDVDERPDVRLTWLFVLMSLPVLAIGLRLAWLQCFLTDDYVDAFDVTTVAFESIPTHDGRILSADGRVLADDLQQFDVLVQYRWLESPPNAAWLKQQAVARLSREERRKKPRIEEEQKKVLAQRDAIWQRLATLSDTEPDRLEALRAGVQQRVERIVASVDWKRHEREFAGQHDIVAARPSDVSGWWNRIWHTTVNELTTPPHRESNEPVVVQEELRSHRLLNNIPLRVAAEIQAHPEDFPGLKVETSALRIYPQKSLAPHIVGSRVPINDDELAERKSRFPDRDPLDYQLGDRIGKSGIERRYDRELRGVRGMKRIVRNRRGEVTKTEIIRDATVGRDIVLSLNLELQQRLEGLLDRTLAAPSDEKTNDESGSKEKAGACIVALDVHTGEVLAAASAPRYDLDLFVHPNQERWKELMDDPRRPFFDRATQMTLPPGSVFKALTSVAFLESGQIDPGERIDCAGFLDSPNRYRCYIYSHYHVGHGPTDLGDALAQSCNVYFFKGARKIGPQPLVAWAERFGFGQPTGIDLPGEQGGHLPRPPVDSAATGAKRNASSNQKKWQPGDTLGLAIGQSRLLVTPMQVARMMATIANGGRLITPHLVRSNARAESLSADELITPAATEPQVIPGLHPMTLDYVREGLEKVVADRRGTGYKSVRMKEVAIAGKTGTAEVGGDRPDHAWFAGYVPADRPKIAFVVLLEYAGSGGRAAGPVAKEFVQTLLELGMLHRTEVTQSDE